MGQSARVHSIEATPTLDTNAYADTDRMGSLMTLTCGNDGSHSVTLIDVFVLDKDDQGIAFDILFFNASPTIASADNANISITDAELEKCIGVVNVSSYTDLLTAKVANPKNIGLQLKPSASDGKLYALLVSRGAPTHTASGLVIKFKFSLDNG